MTDREFVSTFVQQKERFISQNMPRGINCKTLDLFESWLMERLSSAKGEKSAPVSPKTELPALLDQAIEKADTLLQKKDIRIKRISLNVLGNKSKTRCIKVYPFDNLYYRICKTSPRKGKHKGENLIAIELIMDGNKNNIFVPMAAEKDNIENQLGIAVERERPSIEATGKYRLKVLFNLDEKSKQEIAGQLGIALADFVCITNRYLQKIKRFSKSNHP
ncbi:hypothetical protein [Desulfoscipio sp. XC116]|uniref:hypothetical protein n=1 Tax=Desulfoscipio sp. XC116 TaxID=3144975 RepID=UPI00325B981A